MCPTLLEYLFLTDTPLGAKQPSSSTSFRSPPASSTAMSLTPPPTQAPRAGNAAQADLYNKVFGNEGSDVSDLSDSGDERPSQRLAFPPRPAARSPSDSAERVDRDEEEEDRDDDDVYVPGTTSNAAKIPKFKKVAARETVDDNDDDEGVEESRKVRKKKKRRVDAPRRRVERREAAVDEEEAAPIYDEETRELSLYVEISTSWSTMQELLR